MSMKSNTSSRKNSLIQKLNLNLEYFSERNLENEINNHYIGYNLKKVREVNDKNKSSGKSLYSLLHIKKRINLINDMNVSDRKECKSGNMTERYYKRNLKPSLINDSSKWKSEMSSFCNSDRKGNLVVDLRKKKTDFITKQREYLQKKVEFRTNKILPRIYAIKEDNEIDNKRDDVYQEIDAILNEPEYVKKYLIPKESYLNLNNSNNTIINRKTNYVKLQDLLPKGKGSVLKKGFTIKILEKGNDYVYHIIKEKNPEDKTNKSSNILKLNSGYIINKENSIVRTRNNIPKSTTEIKKESKDSSIKVRNNGNNLIFRKTMAKIRNREQIAKKISKEMGKLNEVKNAIHDTFNLAINELYNKEAMIFMDD